MAEQPPLSPLRRPPPTSPTNAGEMKQGALLQKYVPGQKVEPPKRSHRASHERDGRLKGHARFTHTHPLLAKGGSRPIVPYGGLHQSPGTICPKLSRPPLAVPPAGSPVRSHHHGGWMARGALYPKEKAKRGE